MPLRKEQPSTRISREIAAMLAAGPDEKEAGDFLTHLIRKGSQKLIQEVLEQEVADYLGRGYYERGDQAHPGQRNGYEPKTIKTGEGKIVVDAPQLRNTTATYRSAFLERIDAMTAELKRLVVEMYTRGMSTRDVEDTLVDEEGRSYLSKSAVSHITDSLNAEFEAFQKRDLSNLDVVYLFVDGVYEALRFETADNEAVLCAWAILSNGTKTLLHLALGNKESYDGWQDFFRNMQGRGLRQPLLVVGDGAPGLIKAVGDCFPCSRRQRCIAHKLRNIAGKLPQAAMPEVMPQMRAIFYAVNREVAELTAKQIVEKYGDVYPAAINCLQDDLEACLNFLAFPFGHHRFIRTTNLLERSFGEEKRRTKTIPKFPTEKSGLKLVYGTLIRVSKKWQRVQMSDFDLALLRKLRKLQAPKAFEEANFISWKLAA